MLRKAEVSAKAISRTMHRQNNCWGTAKASYQILKLPRHKYREEYFVQILVLASVSRAVHVLVMQHI